MANQNPQTQQRPFFAVIDPAGHTPEIECANLLASYTAAPISYHLPALLGRQSLDAIAEDMDRCVGIIVLGSSTSVHENIPWQSQLALWLETQIAKNIPILAICYGHQLIAHMFGGTVEYIASNQAKTQGFRDVSFNEDASWLPATSGPLAVSHNEIVTSCPKVFSSWASSKAYKFDGLVHDTKPIWTAQPHLEACPSFMNNLNITQPNKLSEFEFGASIMKNFLSYCCKNYVDQNA